MPSRIPVTVIPPGKRVRVESSFSLSPDLVRKRITAFRELDLTTASVEQVADVLAKVLRGYATTTLQIRPQTLYRARKRTGPAPFGHYRDLWYVPPEKADLVQMGRLNDTSEVVFYCADSQHIALVEVRPQVGDRICMLECELDSDAWLRVMPLGIHRHLEAHKPELTAHDYEDKGHEKDFVEAENRQALKILQEFLVEELVRVVPDGTKHLYKTTVALARLMLPAEANLHGMVYPSIAASLQGMNIMLTCGAADALIVPKRAWELHLFEETGPRTFNARMYPALQEVNVDGDILWPKVP